MLRRGSADMHRISIDRAETENSSSSKLDKGVQGVCRRLV
jgi:hypothetical protein